MHFDPSKLLARGYIVPVVDESPATDMLDNELVNQKNHILGLVNDGQYETALMLLDFSAELWEACEYGYKTREIRQRIKDDVRRRFVHATHHKTEEKWRKLYDSIAA